MNKEILRMQLLSGVITESEYKAKLEEFNMDQFSFGGQGSSKASFEDKWNEVPNANKEILKKSTGKEPVKIMASSKGENYVITKGTDGKFYRYQYTQAENPGKPVGPFNSEEEAKKLNESLNENFVGMGMVGNIFDREKTDYEIAFEHFSKGTSLNEELEEDQSPSDNTGVDHYFDFYISNKDTQVTLPNSNKKVPVPSGTVIRAIGGGVWKSLDSNIKTNINSLKGNSDFDVVNNTIWPDTMDLVDEIEAWARSTNDLIQKDPKNIQKIIDDRAKVIASIKNMI